MSQNPADCKMYFSDRFGVEETTWEPFQIRVGNQSVHLVAESLHEFRWDVKDRGFRIASLTTESFKPSTRGLQWLGGKINRNRVEIEASDLQRLLRRKTIEGNETSPLNRGYVALSYRTIVLGCGFWTGNVLRTQISKAQTREFPRAEISPR